MLDDTSIMPAVAGQLTCAHAIAVASTWLELPPKYRSDIVSALRTVARLVGLPVDAVLLTPANIRETLLTKSATGYGIKEGRLRNVLSALRVVLRRLGVIDSAGPPPTPAWSALLSLMEDRKRAGLMTFARYCSATGVAPEQVTDQTLEAFLSWMDARTIIKRPVKTAGEVRGAWNSSAKRITGWPQTKLCPLRRKDQYVLPLDAFPATFQRDLQIFCESLGGSSIEALFGVDGDSDLRVNRRPRCSRPISVRMRADHCRWAASALVASGTPLKDVTSLAVLVSSLDQVKRVLHFLHRKAGNRPSAGAGHIADVLRMIAAHHVRLPAATIEKISSYRNPVALTYRGMTKKNRDQIRRIMEPQNLTRLIALPAALMRTARILRVEAPVQAASLALRAAAIDLLLVCPVRLANLTGIQIDRHLRRANPPHGPFTDIYFPPDEVKNGRVIDMPLQGETALLLDEWIRDFRPALSSPGCRYLFPGRETGDRPITPQGMREAIKDVTLRHAGVTLSPHQFRHLAAHIFLQAHPGHFEDVSRFLGHSDPNTAYNFYCGLETTASVQRLADLVDAHRRNLRCVQPRKTARTAHVRKIGAPRL